MTVCVTKSVVLSNMHCKHLIHQICDKQNLCSIVNAFRCEITTWLHARNGLKTELRIVLARKKLVIVTTEKRDNKSTLVGFANRLTDRSSGSVDKTSSFGNNAHDIMQYFVEIGDDYDEQRSTGDPAFYSRGICMCRQLCVSAAIYYCALESTLFLFGRWPTSSVANHIALAIVLQCLQIPHSPLRNAFSLVDQVFLQEERNCFRTTSWCESSAGSFYAVARWRMHKVHSQTSLY